MKRLFEFLKPDHMALFLRRANGWLTIFWTVMIPISVYTGWVSSVTYVAALSLWALVSGHLSAWQAARVEYFQDIDANVSEVLEEVRRLRQDLEAAGVLDTKS